MVGGELKMMYPFMTLDEGSEEKNTIKQGNDTLNETLKDRILGLVKTNASINQSVIAKELDVSLATIKREMKALKERGLLIRKGAKKDGEWLVNDLE